MRYFLDCAYGTLADVMTHVALHHPSERIRTEFFMKRKDAELHNPEGFARYLRWEKTRNWPSSKPDYTVYIL